MNKRNSNGEIFVGFCANGVPVYDRVNSHWKNSALTTELMVETLSKISPTKDFDKIIVELGRVVGTSQCVVTTSKDEIVMIQRYGRQGATRMVKGRNPDPCTKVVVVLKKNTRTADNYYVIITAFIGEGSEPEPWDKSLVPGSKEHERACAFWDCHALIYTE